MTWNYASFRLCEQIVNISYDNIPLLTIGSSYFSNESPSRHVTSGLMGLIFKIYVLYHSVGEMEGRISCQDIRSCGQTIHLYPPTILINKHMMVCLYRCSSADVQASCSSVCGPDSSAARQDSSHWCCQRGKLSPLRCIIL